MKRKVFLERRQFPRAVHILGIEHRLAKKHGKTKKEYWHFSLTEDMSAVGLRFCSAIPYKVGDVLELKVTLSGVIDVFNGFGKVLRVETIKKTPQYKIAVYFAGLEKKKTCHKQHKGF